MLLDYSHYRDFVENGDKREGQESRDKNNEED